MMPNLMGFPRLFFSYSVIVVGHKLQGSQKLPRIKSKEVAS